MVYFDAIIKRSLRLHIVPPIFFLIPAIAFAQVRKWKDENGNVHFGDKPPEGVGESDRLLEFTELYLHSNNLTGSRVWTLSC